MSTEQKVKKTRRRKSTGGVLARPTLDGEVSYAIRFRAGGRRRQITLGTSKDGWTPERAWEELDRTLESVWQDQWRPSEKALNEIIRDHIDSSSDIDPDAISRNVLDSVSPDVINAEIDALVAGRVRQLIAQRRKNSSETEMPYKVPGEGWKKFGDCTARDCDALADEYMKRSSEFRAHGRRMRETAEVLRASGATTVRDLAPGKMVTLRRPSQ